MIHFNGSIVGEQIVWELIRYDDEYIDDGITISFHLYMPLKEREALNYLRENLSKIDYEWLRYSVNKWTVNLTQFKAEFNDGIDKMLNESDIPEVRKPGVTYLGFRLPTKLSLDLLDGILEVKPEFTHPDPQNPSRTTVNFIITYEDIMNTKPKRIFLSHKSADKPMVRDFKEILRTIGFDPWMDEDDLKAGDKLHRGIAQGFEDSCAAIFFITKNYVDEKYLATEIDYAMNQHYAKDDRFKIITLIFPDHDEQINIPTLLKQFVYKNPKSQFDALAEIIKALPLKLDGVSYKE